MLNKQNIPEFGIKRDNEERRDGGYAIVFDPASQKYAVGIQPNGRLRLFSGGVDEGETIEQGTLREITEEGGLYDFDYIENMGSVITHYHNALKNVNRLAHATCFLVILKSANTVPVQLEEHETFTLTWVTGKELLDNLIEFNKDENSAHWIYSLKQSVAKAVELGYDKTSDLENFK